MTRDGKIVTWWTGALVAAGVLANSVAFVGYARAGGLVTVSTAAGPVTVAPSFAPRIVPFIADVVARGFHGRVHCYARGGHVRHSLHYSGNACDFAQRGWGLTVRPMYHVADLAARYGLRDGCTFRDCGHIDAGGAGARGRSHRRYAAHQHHQHPHYAVALPVIDRFGAQ